MATKKNRNSLTRFIGSPDAKNREKNDFYATPDCAINDLLDKIDKHNIHFKDGIWEPSAGDGAISEVFKKRGYPVISTDLIQRNYPLEQVVDFLQTKSLLQYDIITNPPFKIMRKFADHALNLGCQNLMLFGRLAFLEGQTRKSFFENTPLKNVWVFSYRVPFRRPDYKGKVSGLTAFAWYHWERGYEGKPTIGWI